MYENTQKCKKIKGFSITWCFIWLINISKCAYWLDTHSVNVWWSYVLLNSNAVHFCDIFFRHRSSMFLPCPNKESGKNCYILQCFGCNYNNKDVLMIQRKFKIISKAGLPEFLKNTSSFYKTHFHSVNGVWYDLLDCLILRY